MLKETRDLKTQCSVDWTMEQNSVFFYKGQYWDTWL